VRRRPEVCLRAPSTALGRRTCTAHPSQVLRRLAASALPQRLDRLLQTTLRRTRVRPAVSRPLYSPRRHLQPSLARIDIRPGPLSMACLCRPKSTETIDPLARRFPASLLTSPTSQGLRSHPPLRLPRQPKERYCFVAGLRCSPRSSTASRIGTLHRTNH